MNAPTIRAVLGAAAVVDLALAALILIPATPVMDALGIPVGSPVMNFRFAGLLLALLPVYYILGACRADLAPAIGAGAAIVRVIGVMFLSAHLLGGASRGYVAFLVVEAGFAIAHAVSLRRDGYSIRRALTGRSVS